MGWFHILAFKGIPHGDADNYLSQKFKKKSMEWVENFIHFMMIVRFVQGLEW